MAAVDVTHVLAELLARNRGPDPLNPGLRRQPDYGVMASLDGNVLAVLLTFRRGAAYCCREWGCHLALTDGKRWEALRGVFASHRIAIPTRLELRLSCVIEEGTMFFNLDCPDPTRRHWYAFEPAVADHYEVSTVEAVAL